MHTLDDAAAGDDGCEVVKEEGNQAREVARGWLQVLGERAAAGGLEVARLEPVAHVRAHGLSRQFLCVGLAEQVPIRIVSRDKGAQLVHRPQTCALASPQFPARHR